MERIQQGGKNNTYNGNFNNDNLPARMATLGHKKTEYVKMFKHASITEQHYHLNL